MTGGAGAPLKQLRKGENRNTYNSKRAVAGLFISSVTMPESSVTISVIPTLFALMGKRLKSATFGGVKVARHSGPKKVHKSQINRAIIKGFANET